MDTNNKHKIDFILNDKSSSAVTKSNRAKRIHCNECNKKRKPSDDNRQICHVCYKIKETKALFNQKPSGIKVIDDFIEHTQTNDVRRAGKMEFVPYDQFKNVEFIAEGGFSKIYKATWIDGPVISYKNKRDIRHKDCTVVLKKLNNSKNVTSKELNEVRTIFYFNLIMFKINKLINFILAQGIL